MVGAQISLLLNNERPHCIMVACGDGGAVFLHGTIEDFIRFERTIRDERVKKELEAQLPQPDARALEAPAA